MKGIDLQGTSDQVGGSNVGWIDNGDWTEYNINVTTSGMYDFTYRIASNSTSGRLLAQIEGQLISAAAISVPNTGGWQNWSFVKAPGISLAAGTHTIRLLYDKGGFNINYLTILKSGISIQNIALNKPVTSSSDQSSGSSAKFANNGKSGTRWASSFRDLQWIYIDLQDTYSVQK
ncbi:MAG: carbohydrate-binding protein [Cytophagales bacterium]|nr:carbohydrate-binding protein [Cytophaga sp.]